MSRSTFCLLIGLIPWILNAQSNVIPIGYTIPGAVYTQNFDGLPSSGSYTLAGKGPINLASSPINGTNLNGWQFLLIGGTNSSAGFAVSTGSSTGNGLYSLGTASNTERALGSLASSSGITAFGVIFTNNTGVTLNNIMISFTAEQWRKGGSGNKNYWIGKVKTGNLLNIDQPNVLLDSNLNFNSKVFTIGGTSLNGNLPENQQTINYTISNLIWKVGEQLLIRWDDQDETGNDDACSIDNFRLSATLNSFTPTVQAYNTVETNARTATLFGSVNDNNATSSVKFEIDTSVSFSHPIQYKSNPDSIPAFSGMTNTSCIANNLSPNTLYFFRIKASNLNGTITSTPVSFTTQIELPTVLTGSVISITSNSVIVQGNVIVSGGAAVAEKGFVWSINRNLTITDHTTTAGNGIGKFEQQLTQLPTGKWIYFNSYAKNSGGIGWGNLDSFLTKTKILSLTTEYISATNKNEVSFILKSENDISGISAGNFSIESKGITNAYIIGITKKENDQWITVNTGKGDGSLSLLMFNDNGLLPRIENIPFHSNSEIIIDKTPPIITKLSYENRSYRIEDSIIIFTAVSTDKDSIQLINGVLNDIPIKGWKKVNDSTYSSFCKIESGITDVPAGNNTLMKIVVSDQAGNQNKIQEFILEQDKDLMDAHSPYIKNLIIPANKTFKKGDTLDFTFIFNEKIRSDKGFSSCSYGITIGTKLKQCNCISLLETDSLVFRYIVQSGDFDKDGIKISTAISLNNIQIMDIAGNIALLNFVQPSTKNILIDAVAPSIQKVTTPAPGIYRTGNVLDFVMNISKKIIFTDTSSQLTLPIFIGNKIRNAEYISGNGSNTLLFRYTIIAEDFDKDGIKISDQLVLNGVLIKDEIGNDINPTLANIGALSGIRINPVTATISAFIIPSTKIFAKGDELDLIVKYSETVWVDTSKGLPYVRLAIGKNTREAIYQNGAGSTELVFTYTISKNDFDTNGIEINNSISLNKSVITDANNNVVPISINVSYDSKGLMVDGINPRILNVEPPPDKTYKIGDTLIYKINISEPVYITQQIVAPTIGLIIGKEIKDMSYVSGTGTTQLLFKHIVEEGEYDMDGIKTAPQIELNLSTIQDWAGNDLINSFSILITKNVMIDGIGPTLKNIIYPTKGMYPTGNNISFIFQFSEPIKTDSLQTPISFQLMIGNQKKNVLCSKRGQSNEMVFQYQIQENDIEKKGIQVAFPNDLAKRIIDLAGNVSSLSLLHDSLLLGVLINPVTIKCDSIHLNKGNYKMGDSIFCKIKYNEPLYITNGFPYIRSWISTKEKKFIYLNGSGTEELLFYYVIAEGDESKNGINMDTVINASNSTLKDINGFNIPLLLKDAGKINEINIDGIRPFIDKIIVPNERTYGINDTLQFSIHFSEKIKIRTNPDSISLNVLIGPSTKKLRCLQFNGGDELVFSYIISKGDLSKNGIKLVPGIISNHDIFDKEGNEAVLLLNSPLLYEKIKVDGISPIFVSTKDEKIISCANQDMINLQNYLLVQDEESGEKLNWQIFSTNQMGECDSTLFSSLSTNKQSAPNNIHYIPKKNETGSDTLLVTVNDGINAIQKRLTIEILAVISNNKIGSDQITCINSSPDKLIGNIPEGGSGNYTFLWERTSKDSTQFISSSGINNEVSYQPSSITNTIWYRRKVSSGTCIDFSEPVKITPVKFGYWTGLMDSNWNEPNNWCSSFIPDKQTDVIVNLSSANNPNIKDSAKCLNLILLNKSGLTISGFLELFGSILSEEGKINALNGTLQFSGNSTQSISGKQFNDHTIKKITLNNAVGVTIVDSLLITESLRLQKGILISDDQLNLSVDSRIQPSSSGTIIKGNVHVTHLMQGGRRVFHLLSNPFTEDIGLDMISKQVDISGEGGSTNGFTTTQTNQPSSFRYDPIFGNDSSEVEAGWIPFTNVNGKNENVWRKNLGIRLLMRGKPGQGLNGMQAGNGQNGTYYPETVILQMSGTLAVGDQEIILQNGTMPGYHIIGNPYISNIDLSRITRGNNVGKYFWIWDPHQGIHGGYTSYPFSKFYSLSSFGAFIARSNSNSENSFLFTENCKTDIDPSISFANITPEDPYYIVFTLSSDSISWDRLIILSKDSARSSFDKNDAEKFLNPDVNMYSISRDNRKLSIDARSVNNQSIIPIGIDVDQDQQFQLRITEMNLPVLNTLQLHDKFLDIWFPLAKDSIYSFFTTSDTLSKGKNRFELITKKLRSDTLRASNGINAELKPIPAKDHVIVHFKSVETGNTQIRIMNVSGMPLKIFSFGMMKEAELSIPLNGLPDKIYLIEIRCGDQMITKKILKE